MIQSGRQPLISKLAIGTVRHVAALAAFLLALHAMLFLLFLVLPSSVETIAGTRGVDPAYRETLKRELGLDRSWPQRYTDHLKRIVRLDFGHSVRGGFPIGEMLRTSIVNSLPLLIAVGAGAVFGAISMLWALVPRGRGFIRKTAHFSSTFLVLPPFVVATAAYGMFRWLTNAFPGAWEEGLRWTVAFLATGCFPFVLMASLAAPLCVEFADSHFVRTYRSIGLSWNVVRFRLLLNLWHALRPALARALLMSILSTAFVEWLFGINGFGRLGLTAFQGADFSLMFAWAMVTGIVVVSLSVFERW